MSAACADGGETAARSLGGFELFTLAFGAIVGVSWIVLVGDWLELAGPLGSILAFTLGGVVVLIVGYSYAELGSLFPRSGGELVFAMHIYGPRTAYAVASILLLLYLSLVAFESVSISWVFAALVPVLTGPTLYRVADAGVSLGGATVGMIASLLIATINYRGARSAGRLQDYLTIAKILMVFIFIVAGLCRTDTRNLQPLFGMRAGKGALDGFLSLLGSTPLFFAGFGVITQAMGAARPHEFARLGRILIAVIAASVAFYGLAILVVAGLVDPRRVARYELPAVQAFKMAFGSTALVDVVLAVGLLGLMTVWNAVFFAAVRVMEGLSEQRVLEVTAFRRRGLTSAPGAVLVALAVSASGALLGRSILLPIVSVAGFAVTLLFLFVCVACLRRRRRRPDLSPPYRVPGGASTIVLGIALSCALAVTSMIGFFGSATSYMPVELKVIVIWSVLAMMLWWCCSDAGRRPRSPQP